METRMTPRRTAFGLAAAAFGALASLVARPARAEGRHHRVVFQVSSSDPALMNMAINNMLNMRKRYEELGETVGLELVTFGPGLVMLREDMSPVKDRLAALKGVTLSACENTRRGMETAEGHPVAIIPQARAVPAGVVRLVELQEAGWSYLRP
jgi:intracellular sulfur oxidation DsrE/DsrF family protein